MEAAGKRSTSLNLLGLLIKKYEIIKKKIKCKKYNFYDFEASILIQKHADWK
jgi:hypothetical protein